MLCIVYIVFASMMILLVFFFFKQKTAYEMRISDWTSDVCSSDLGDGACADVGMGANLGVAEVGEVVGLGAFAEHGVFHLDEIADPRTLLEHGAGAQAGIGADRSAAFERRAFGVRERADHPVVGNVHAVAEDLVGSDGDITAAQRGREAVRVSVCQDG